MKIFKTLFVLALFLTATAYAIENAEEAKRFYEAVVRAQPQNANAHYDLANVYLAEGRYAEALEHYGTANKFGLAASRMENYYFNSSVCYSKVGKMAEAIESIEACLKINPENNGAKELLAIYKGRN